MLESYELWFDKGDKKGMSRQLVFTPSEYQFAEKIARAIREKKGIPVTIRPVFEDDEDKSEDGE